MVTTRPETIRADRYRGATDDREAKKKIAAAPKVAIVNENMFDTRLNCATDSSTSRSPFRESQGKPESYRNSESVTSHSHSQDMRYKIHRTVRPVCAWSHGQETKIINSCS